MAQRLLDQRGSNKPKTVGEALYRENPTIPPNWAITVSDNGWTTDELGFKWIQHFNKWTKDVMKGVHRLLILDGHGSHFTPEFDNFCEENKIIKFWCRMAAMA